MFFNSAKNQIDEDKAYTLVWETAQEIASKGQFDKLHAVLEPVGNQSLSEVAGGFDSEENRLLILNPRHWTLLNGEDSRSRDDVRSILGIGEKTLVVDNAASCVVAAVNTYQRRYAVQAAQDVLTWKLVADQVVEGRRSPANPGQLRLWVSGRNGRKEPHHAEVSIHRDADRLDSQRA